MPHLSIGMPRPPAFRKVASVCLGAAKPAATLPRTTTRSHQRHCIPPPSRLTLPVLRLGTRLQCDLCLIVCAPDRRHGAYPLRVRVRVRVVDII